MITEDSVWIHIVPSDPAARQRAGSDVDGKWLCFGPKEHLHACCDSLNRLVEQGALRAAKIARKDPRTDPFPNRECVLCAYTSSDPEEKKAVAKRLREIGLRPARWKSEAETLWDWSPGGKLHREWQATRRRRKSRTP